jgi:hypothetical protein
VSTVFVGEPCAAAVHVETTAACGLLLLLQNAESGWLLLLQDGLLLLLLLEATAVCGLLFAVTRCVQDAYTMLVGWRLGCFTGS